MIKLEPLAGHHNRKGFDCGNAQLNAWLAQTALQHQVKGISRTIVAVTVDPVAVDQQRILGFYALASAFVLIEDLPEEHIKRYPRQIPVTRLGRLAICTDLQAQGLGKLLLADAIVRTRQAALAVGSAGLLVDAKDDGAAEFYQHYGFRPCAKQPHKLFMPIW